MDLDGWCFSVDTYKLHRLVETSFDRIAKFLLNYVFIGDDRSDNHFSKSPDDSIIILSLSFVEGSMENMTPLTAFNHFQTMTDILRTRA
jgi:hypothetical protein